jgi:hypothetical protein
VTDENADDAFAAAVEHRNAQIKHWGTWVAAHDILTEDGVLMFKGGTPVPVEHVEKFGWSEGDDPFVLKREDALKKEGFVVDGLPALSPEEQILDAVTEPPQGPASDTGETPKGPSTTKSTSTKSNAKSS